MMLVGNAQGGGQGRFKSVSTWSPEFIPALLFIAFFSCITSVNLLPARVSGKQSSVGAHGFCFNGLRFLGWAITQRRVSGVLYLVMAGVDGASASMESHLHRG